MSNTDALLEALLRIAHTLESDFDRVAAASSLTAQSGAALMMMLHHGDAIKMHDLALRLACDAGNLSGTIDRLEERSLVDRAANPADRRVRLLRLTARGRKTAEKLYAASAAGTIPARLEALSASDRERLAALLAALLPMKS